METKIEQLRPWLYSYSNAGLRIISDSGQAGDVDSEKRREMLRHILDVLKDCYFSNFSGLRALDMGCLEGHYSEILCSYGFNEVVSIDLSNEHIKRATFLLQEFFEYKNSTVIHGNVLDKSLMCSIGQFDLILFHGLLYHLHSPAAALDIVNELINDDEKFCMLLSHGLVMDYNEMVSSKPIAEVAVRDWPINASSIVSDPVNQSSYDRIATILNAKALFKVLRAYGFNEMIAYDTELGRIWAKKRNHVIRLVAFKEKQNAIFERLNSNIPSSIQVHFSGI